MAKVNIVHGSGGGNTEIVCERVAELLAEKKHKVTLLRAKSTEPKEALDCDVLLLGSPTYGHGLLESYFEKFLKKLEGEDLEGKKCVAIGLGDPKYDPDYHIEAARVIVRFLREKGAAHVYRPLMISKSPFPYLEDFIPKWVDGLHYALNG